MSPLWIVALLAIASAVWAEKIVAVVPCTRGDFGTGTLHEVRITPCPEASKRRPCILRKGSEVTIEADLTPSIGADKVTGRAFWANRPMDLPLTNMNTDACATLNCPMEAGRRQTYRYTLPVSRSFPNRRYDVKWRLNSGPFNMCFQFPIQVVS